MMKSWKRVLLATKAEKECDPGERILAEDELARAIEAWKVDGVEGYPFPGDRPKRFTSADFVTGRHPCRCCGGAPDFYCDVCKATVAGLGCNCNCERGEPTVIIRYGSSADES